MRVSEVLLERGALCDKREYQVQVCGRGTGWRGQAVGSSASRICFG